MKQLPCIEFTSLIFRPMHLHFKESNCVKFWLATVVAEKHFSFSEYLPDGSVTRVKEEDHLINRSVEDFYYLQTYLQAKVGEIW
jgi:hypothetical protein